MRRNANKTLGKNGFLLEKLPEKPYLLRTFSSCPEYIGRMKYFGTDGIRRHASFFNDVFLSKFAAAVASLPSCKRVVIGRDTRPSGREIERTLALLLSSYGVETVIAGILPSPALALCVREYACSYGIMVTASHNPPCDNGLKLFSSIGAKLSKAEEDFLEERLSSPRFLPYKKTDVLLMDGPKTYSDHLLTTHAFDLSGKRILLDCAFGAASSLAAPLFRAFGAEVVAVCDEKAGEKINVDCGATHPERLFDPSSRFDLAFSYDGDADRVLAVKNGRLFSGDDLLFCLSLAEKEKGVLRNNAVCGTIMTNSGIEKAFLENNITFYRSDVGDRALYEKMVEKEVFNGAETSGHVLLRQYENTGDGILTSLLFASLDKEKGVDIAALPKKYPSVEATLPVTDEERSLFLSAQKSGLSLPVLRGVRSIVRASGTENKIRFLCEARSNETCLTALRTLVDKVKEMFS